MISVLLLDLSDATPFHIFHCCDFAECLRVCVSSVSLTQVFMYFIIEFKIVLHIGLTCPIRLIPRVRWERVKAHSARQPKGGHVPVGAWRWEGVSYRTGLVGLAGSGHEGKRKRHDHPCHMALKLPVLWAAHFPLSCA